MTTDNSWGPFRDTYIAPRDEFVAISAVRYARDVAEECDYRQATYNDRSVLTQIDDPDWHRLNQHIKENQ